MARFISLSCRVLCTLSSTCWPTLCCPPGFPKPRVYWFKDGHPLRCSERILLRADREIHSVEVRGVKREDMGEYSAYISNEAGSAYSSARLIVLSKFCKVSRGHASQFKKKNNAAMIC